MSLAIIFTMAAVSVAAFLITLSRVVGWAWIIRRATLIDVVFTLVIGVLMGFTIYGILIAVVAGLMMALVLNVGRVLMKFGESVTVSTDSEFDAQGNWIYNKAPYV